MSKRWVPIYGGFFLAALVLALLVTGVLQERILPRLVGKAAAAPESAAPSHTPEERPKAAAIPRQEGVPTAETGETAGSSLRVAEDGGQQESRPAAESAVASAASPKSGADQAGHVKRLARVYEAMRPKEAAAVLEKLERPFAADILVELRERQSSKILAAMNPAAAAELTRILGRGADRGQP